VEGESPPFALEELTGKDTSSRRPKIARLAARSLWEGRKDKWRL